PDAAEALHRGLSDLDIGIGIRDEVRRLPKEDAEYPFAIISAAAAPMLAGPLISESHLSQVLLGHRVVILREHGRWLQCRSSDGYIGWLHRRYTVRVTEAEARVWEVGGEGRLHLSLGGQVLDPDGRILIRLPWGARIGIREGRA